MKGEDGQQREEEEEEEDAVWPLSHEGKSK